MNEPSLLVTFFCRQPEAANRLIGSFTQTDGGLDLVSVSDGEWRNDQQRTYLWSGPLPGTGGGNVVQLALNTPEAPPQGWQSLWERLQRALGSLFATVNEGLWGYTLFYQVSVNEAESENTEEFVEEIPLAGSGERLAADTCYGQLWLLATPSGDGAMARSAYVMFTPPERERVLAQQWTWAPRGQMLPLELALHRAQSQRRRYLAVADNVRSAVEDLWSSSHADLLQLDVQERETSSRSEVGLRILSERYSKFSVAVSNLRLIRRNISIQIANARQCASDLGLGDAQPVQHQLALLHQTQIQIEDQIGYARETLDAANSALGVLQTRFAEREAQAQEHRNLLLAFVGLILGAGELVTEDVADAFLDWLMALFGKVPPTSYTTAETFVIRCILALLVALTGMAIVWMIGKARRA